jgi:hypothetical protein
MKRRRSVILTAGILCFTIVAAFAAEKQQSSFWKKLLKFTGISASPGQMKSPDEDLATPGQVWLADLSTGEQKKLTEELGFRSPIFTANGKAVLLVRSNQLYQLQLEDGPPRRLFEIPGLVKLIGFDREATNEVCCLVRVDSVWQVQTVSLPDGAINKIEHDPDSREDRRLLTYLKGWEREYEPDLSLYPARQTKVGLSGQVVAWNDIILKRTGAKPQNVSKANGYDCSQPSLSPDANKVVYIKAVAPN